LAFDCSCLDVDPKVEEGEKNPKEGEEVYHRPFVVVDADP
jgi:hypothetical protein